MSNTRLISSILVALIACFRLLSFADGATLNSATNLHRLFIGQSIRPEDEGQPAEIEGTVTFIGQQGRDLKLEISSRSGHVSIWTTNAPAIFPELLLKSRVRIDGICAGVRSEVNGITVGSLQPVSPDSIVILQTAEELWQRYPAQAIKDLPSARPATTNRPNTPIVHVRGSVSLSTTNAVLKDESGSVVVTPVPEAPASGEIEMLGTLEPTRTGQIFRSRAARPLLPENVASNALPTLTSIEQIHWLKPEDAARRYPVKIRGVITWIQPGKRNGSVQDATGGIYVRSLVPPGGVGTSSRGIFCEIQGFTTPGRFAPGIECKRSKMLGVGEDPEPLRPTWEDINSGALDVQWIEVRGLVSMITNQTMVVLMKGGSLTCTVPTINDPAQYKNAVIRARGVVVYHTDTSRNFHGEHLDIPSEDFISIEKPASVQADAPLVHGPDDLLRYNPDGSAFLSVKVTGQLLHTRDGTLYVMDNTNGIRIIPASDTSSWPPGTLIEAVGFPDIGDPEKPALTVREATVTAVGIKPLPAAKKISRENLLNPAHDSTLVEIDSELLNTALYQTEQVFELQTGSRVYRARLNIATNPALDISPGSRIEVSGVYAASQSKRLDAGPFELFLNSPQDIRVVKRPSWWTGVHTAIVVGSMTLLLLLGLIWVAVLHQQVAHRTTELVDANRSLRREMTERQRAEDELVRTRSERLVEQERNRIARDLHDDLGSRVTRVVLMLDEFALENQSPAQVPGEPIRKISAAAQDIIHSLDENVWAVNSRNDTLSHLIDYIGHFAADFLDAANVRCRMDFPEDPPELPLSADVRHNLFLTVKEALTNAVRHAEATEIWLRARIDDDGTLTLNIEDNGRGFDAAPGHPSADGLINLRQRMEAIGGRFNLESTVGSGTKVTLTYRCATPK